MRSTGRHVQITLKAFETRISVFLTSLLQRLSSLFTLVTRFTMSLPLTRSLRIAAKVAGFTLAAAVALSTQQAAAEDLIVKFDQSQLLQLPRPAAEVIIGNPSIADVAIQAGNLLVVTGKSFGITNIIALDAERKVIQDQRIIVRRDEVRVVNVYKAADRSTYNCVPQCNPTLMPGDDDKFFDKTLKASQSKNTYSEGAADKASAGGQAN
jgi:Pilus formation protein N terminal region